MSETLLSSLVQEVPGLAVVAAFAWLLLKIVREQLNHYHRVLDGVLERHAEILDRIDRRTEHCAPDQRGPP